MQFWSKKESDTEVLARLHKRLTDVEQRVLSLELEQDTFRDKVLRKIQKRGSDEQEQKPTFKAGLPFKQKVI